MPKKQRKKMVNFIGNIEIGNYINYLKQEDIDKFLNKYQDSLQKLGY